MSDLTLDRLKAWLADENNMVARDQRHDGRGLIRRHQFITNNGYKISIQMSTYHHCVPGESVEMWHCPHSPLLVAYGDGVDPYGHVPLEVVAGYIDALEFLPPLEKQP